MSLLHEIAAAAKWDGTCTLKWSTLSSTISIEGGLEDLPGKNEVQKLEAWAEREGLFMDFDVEFSGCTSHIRTVTFWNNPHAVRARAAAA
jgi:hypothetical protein